MSIVIVTVFNLFREQNVKNTVEGSSGDPEVLDSQDGGTDIAQAASSQVDEDVGIDEQGNIDIGKLF